MDVVDRDFLWRKLKVARTLCVQQRSLEILFDSIAVPPLPLKQKIPHVPAKKQNVNTATANRLKSWNLEYGQEVPPDPNLHRQREILRETNLSCTLRCIATETVDLLKLHYHLQRKKA